MSTKPEFMIIPIREDREWQGRQRNTAGTVGVSSELSVGLLLKRRHTG
jgi:hypothetical protein